MPDRVGHLAGPAKTQPKPAEPEAKQKASSTALKATPDKSEYQKAAAELDKLNKSKK